VVAVVLSGWTRSSAEPAPATAPQAAPTPTAKVVPVDPAAAGPGGLNIRYLDENGKIQRLDVQDLP
jgi:hypothetical protein